MNKERAAGRGLLPSAAMWAALVALLSLIPIWLLRPRPVAIEIGWDIPPFELVDQAGQPFGSGDLAGRPYVINFFFTNCPTICPPLMLTRLHTVTQNPRHAKSPD